MKVLNPTNIDLLWKLNMMYMTCFLMPHLSEISLLLAGDLLVSVYQASRGHMCTQTDGFREPL